MTVTTIKRLLPLAGVLALGGCGLFSKGPGMSVVHFYNHSGRTVLVEDNELRDNREGTFQYPTDSGKALIVFWNGCVHTYIAPAQKPGEFRSTDWMLRGAYRVQLEADGDYDVASGQCTSLSTGYGLSAVPAFIAR